MVKAFIRTEVLTTLKNKVFQDMSPPALNDKAFQGKALTAFMHYAMDSTCVYLHTTSTPVTNIYDTLPNWTSRLNSFDNTTYIFVSK